MLHIICASFCPINNLRYSSFRPQSVGFSWYSILMELDRRSPFKGRGQGAAILVSDHHSSVLYWWSMMLKFVFLFVYGISKWLENKNTAFVLILNPFSAFWDRKSSQLTRQIFNFEISIFFSIFKLIFRIVPGLMARNKRYQQIGRKK